MHTPLKPYFLAPLFLQKLVWIPTRLVLAMFGRHKVYGLEHLRGLDNPVIFVCNHSSEIDPFMVPASLPPFSHLFPLFYLVREKEFYDANGWRRHLFNAWFIALWGGYGVRVGLKDYGTSLKRQIEILQDGGSFCIFPEGKITPDGTIQEAKGGISYLAHSGPCTIVPVGISHVYEMSLVQFFLRKRKTVVRFGKPLKPKELPTGNGGNIWKAEAEYVMKKVAELIESS